MKNNNIAVVGLGSMGKRRIRLIKDYIRNTAEDGILWNIIGVDNRDDRRTYADNELGVRTCASIDDAFNELNIEAVFVATSPSSHASIIKTALIRGAHVFSEINLISKGYEDNIRLAEENGKTLFLSSTPMYRKEMQYIRNQLSGGFTGTYQYHIGQYLPEWHPWENYRDFFAGNKITNGCRELFAIELPWIIDAFGDICRLHSVHNKVSDLEIDYDDVFQVIIEHDSGVTGSIVIDVVSPKPERKLKIWNHNIIIEWEGTPETLIIYRKDRDSVMVPDLYPEVDHDESYAGFVIENAYYDEIVDFFDCVKNGTKSRYSFIKDLDVLKIIDRIGV